MWRHIIFIEDDTKPKHKYTVDLGPHPIPKSKTPLNYGKSMNHTLHKKLKSNISIINKYSSNSSRVLNQKHSSSVRGSQNSGKNSTSRSKMRHQKNDTSYTKSMYL